MKLRGWMILGGTSYVIGIVALVWILHLKNTQASLAGYTVHAPHGWQVQSQDQTGVTFAQNEVGHINLGTLRIVDRRNHPDNPQTFVSSWKPKIGKDGIQVYTATVYHDPIMDHDGLHCVALNWTKSHLFSIFCTTTGGHWRLVLLGKPSDVGGLDDLAKQMPTLGDH
jgi:hypothetical protein